jgi:MFS family permease
MGGLPDSPAPFPTAASRRLPGNVRVLGAASLLNDVASEMAYPLLPRFLVQVLGATPLGLGVIEGAAESVASLLKLWSGGWSDRAGRRKRFVVAGYGLPALVRPLTGLALAPWHLLAIRLTDRVGKGLRTSPRDALIADSTAPDIRGRAFGFHRAMDHLGAALGPLLAMAFLWWRPDGLRTLFLLTLLPGLAVVVLVAGCLRETPTPPRPREPFRWTLAPFGPGFRRYLLALAVFTLGNSSDAFLLLRAGELGVPTPLLPALWCAFHAVKSVGSRLAGHAVDRFGPRRFIFLGWGVYAAVYLAFALATAAWHAWAFFLVYALYYALTEPAEKTLVTRLAGASHKGLAFGWYHLAVGSVSLPASVLFGALYRVETWGPAVAFGSGAALAFLAALLLAGARGDQGRA